MISEHAQLNVKIGVQELIIYILWILFEHVLR